jgi:hypothetical protein
MAFSYSLTGVTRNQRGAPLASVVVDVFDEGTESFLGTATSDSGGNYTVTLTSCSTGVFAVGYLAGSPDVAGTTLNNLVPVATAFTTSNQAHATYGLLLALTN